MKMLLMLSLLLVSGFSQQALADDKADLSALLSKFLDGATHNDAAVHNAFWADELIYTSSNGTRFGKAELMQGVNSSGLLKAEDIDTVYSSEEVKVMQYGDTAVVAFVLVGKSATETKRYLNSGTFVKRNGKWQAVNWQATIKAQ